MGIEKAINFDDLSRLARRRLPKLAFDFVEGGIDDEGGVARNSSAFARHALVPRYMIDASKPDRTVTLFGRRYADPFGIAPTGALSMFRPGSDLMLAKAARNADIPFILSGASTATIEEAAALAPDHTWYQIYLAKDRAISDDMVARAAAARLSTLVLTVDVPGIVKRERNIRNGFQSVRPSKPAFKAQLEALLHPGWLAAYAMSPGVFLANWTKYAPAGATPAEQLAFTGSQLPSPTTWDDVARIRKQWPRAFVLKGIMHPDDAKRAVAMGCDGVIVSNHGGRQLDRSPAPIDVLPAVRDAVGDKATVMFDSGIRRGADIVTALSLGAKACFVGRWTLYGVAAGGAEGAKHAVDMIRGEVNSVMTQIGATSIASLGPDNLMWDNKAAWPSNRGA